MARSNRWALQSAPEEATRRQHVGSVVRGDGKGSEGVDRRVAGEEADKNESGTHERNDEYCGERKRAHADNLHTYQRTRCGAFVRCEAMRLFFQNTHAPVEPFRSRTLTVCVML